jgi:hypothetical protein
VERDPPDGIATRLRRRRDLNVAFSGVILLLSSGSQRTVEHADSAHVEGPFFVVTRWYRDLNRRETVLTLRSDDVVAAEIVKDGVRINCVPGGGEAKT